MTRQLAVWMNGERVGLWTAGATHSLEYDDRWAASPHARPLSLSLPMTSDLHLRGAVVERYFDNLLPDDAEMRRRIRTRFKAKSTQVVDLLTAIGRDCVGAVQLLPPGESPPDIRTVDVEAVGETQVAQLLAQVAAPARYGAPDDLADFRISLAGAQEKTALVRIDQQWFKPRGATPTTHILKLPLGRVTSHDVDLSTSVENEWLCAQTVRALGLEVADCEMVRFGDTSALSVTRFDRQWQDGEDTAPSPYILRLPQEDLCQATGTPPTRKYESEGGPGMAECLDVLGNAIDPAGSRRHFVLAQLAFWLLAAPDGHAKNFSLFLHRGPDYTHTPLYDILSAWPVIGSGRGQLPYQKASMAMALRGKSAHRKLEEIHARHWRRLALQAGGEPVWEAMLDLVRDVEPALGRVERTLPPEFPPSVWNPIQDGMRRHGRRFMQELDTLD